MKLPRDVLFIDLSHSLKYKHIIFVLSPLTKKVNGIRSAMMSGELSNP